MSIEFVPAVCPKCGGELRVPSNLDVVKCMYCGNDVILHNPNQFNVNVEFKRDVTKLLELARISEESQNYMESFKYYSQILEVGPDNRISWFGKARAAASLCTPTSTGLNEAVSYCRIALNYNNTIDKDVLATINSISINTYNYFCKLVDFYKNEYERLAPPDFSPIPIQQWGNNQTKLRLGEEIVAKFVNSAQQGINSFSFCWGISPSRIIGQAIYDSFTRLVNAPLPLHETSKILLHLEQLVETHYPDLEKPNKKRQISCFIATATMGNENHPYVFALRRYRDKVLMQSTIGKIFIPVYYFLSPPLAKLISKNQRLRKISLKFLVLPSYKRALKVLEKKENNCPV